jgi:hypothetical protein
MTGRTLVLQWCHDSENRLTSQWRADFSEALEPLGLPEAPRARGGDLQYRARGVAMGLSYAGRVSTFGLAVALTHVSVLRWIFLPIGG